MNFKYLIKINRSVRGFDRSRLVEREEMLEMIDCARLSASSMSVQPLKFYMTESLEEADLITANAKYAGAHAEYGLPLKGTEPPAYILICHDKRIYADSKRFLKDVGICAQSMTLAACEMGLNCLMMGAFSAEKIRDIMKLPEYFDVMLLIAIGESIEKIEILDAATPEAPVNAQTLEEEYQGSWDKYVEANESRLREYRSEDLAKVQYYREDGVHYAPKRPLEEMIINK